MKPRLDAIANIVNSRSPRERVMLVLLTFMFVLTLDLMLVVLPMSRALMRAMPELEALKSEHQTLRDDKKNEVLIRRDWESLKETLAKSESGFIASDEIPGLLENLSKLASDSGVRILSLKPLESAKKESSSPYTSVPVKITALASGHETGVFLAKLEGGSVFFRIADLKIVSNPQNPKKHNIDISLETYRREEPSPRVRVGLE